MSFRQSIALFKVPSFTPAILAILLATLAEAVAGSYMALLAVEKIAAARPMRSRTAARPIIPTFTRCDVCAGS